MSSGAWMIDGTISAIEHLNSLLGVGDPNTGGVFVKSAAQFQTIIVEQESAQPGSNWMGTAAQRYSANNKLQKQREEKMMGIDSSVASLVSNQAAAVRHGRSVLSFAKILLEIARPFAIAISWIPFVGQWISDAFQAPICANMMAMSVAGSGYVLAKSSLDAAQMLISLGKLVGMLVELLEYEVVHFLREVVSEIEYFISKLEAKLKAFWSAICHMFSELGSNVKADLARVAHFFSELESNVKADLARVAHFFSEIESNVKADLARLAHFFSGHFFPGGAPGLGQSPILSGSQFLSGSQLLSGSSQQANVASALVGANSSHLSDLMGVSGISGLPLTGGFGPTVNPMHALSGQSGRLPSGEQAKTISSTADARSQHDLHTPSHSADDEKNSPIPQAPLAQSARRQTTKDSEAGAAAGAAGAGRAPIEAEKRLSGRREVA